MLECERSVVQLDTLLDIVEPEKVPLEEVEEETPLSFRPPPPPLLCTVPLPQVGSSLKGYDTPYVPVDPGIVHSQSTRSSP